MGEIKAATTKVEDSAWFEAAVRGGLVAYGVVHLLIAWLAVQLALGERDDQASNTGALQQLAEQPFGTVLLWLVVVGMAALVAWQLLEGGWGHTQDDGPKRWFKRGASIGKAAVYGVLGCSAIKIALGSAGSAGSGGGGSSGTDSATADLMNLPAGTFLVGILALVIMGIGANLVRQAWSEKFRERLDPQGNSRDAYIWLGKVGYTAKGIALGIVGVLFAQAAVNHDPQDSGGLDQALAEVLRQPFGPVLLLAIAAGIACYGLFCFAQARHLSR